MSSWNILRAHHAGAAVTFCVRFPLLMVLAIVTLSFFCGTSAQAARPGSQQPGATIVVNSDYGGSVRKRYNQIQQINRLGQRVEIRGRDCLSSCTMYLGAKNVCVSPTTSFGFHGPYRGGPALTEDEFDAWSKVISAHYPSPVRNWYMQKARYSTTNILRIKGAELIRLGVTMCR